MTIKKLEKPKFPQKRPKIVTETFAKVKSPYLPKETIVEPIIEPVIEKEIIQPAEIALPIEVEKPKGLVDAIEFTNGKNVLKITLKKKENRMMRIQIFLNDKTEIRPSTFTGTTPAMGYWNLLKESIK